MNFLELNLADGRKLDIPPYAVQFLEGLDPESRKANPGCKSGLFYDVGGVQPSAGGSSSQSTLQSALVTDEFAELAKAVRLATPCPRVELTTAHGEGVLIETGRIVAIRELAEDHPNGAKCCISHRIGERVLPLDVKQTRDEIRKAMEESVPAPPSPSEK